MPTPLYITGPAGSGKTFNLLKHTAVFGQRLILEEHQSVLAVTYMHGSRQRLETGLAGHTECRKLRRNVCTIDGFALPQWRLCFGQKRIAYAMKASAAEYDERFGVGLSYDQVVQKAAELLQHPTIQANVISTHPLVIVDEFQDCEEHRLAIIQRLSTFVQVIVAADAFQHLNVNSGRCEATAWIEQVEGVKETCLCLHRNERTTNSAIINAAAALRENRIADTPAVQVCVLPTGKGGTLGLAASKILWFLRSARQGATVVLLPSKLKDAEKIVESIQNQCLTKKFTVPTYTMHGSTEYEIETLLTELRHYASLSSLPPDASADAREAMERAARFIHLRGFPGVDSAVLEHFAEKIVHAKRAQMRLSSKLIFSTVHGAKNREFEHVFVLWGYALRENFEHHRRLLYNAITRAKVSCTILDVRNATLVQKDPLMRLLGNPILLKPKPRRKTSTARIQRKRQD
jgi:hypothetical protein